MNTFANNDFKIIAVRILPGCAPHIRKCLKEGGVYNLCNDYEIGTDGTRISRSSNNIPPIESTFFSSCENGSPKINIAAIVGKNGEGKSALIEVIIRIINNCAKEFDFDPFDSLHFVDGVSAELYYSLKGSVYCLVCNNRHNNDNRVIDLYKYVKAGDCLTRNEKPEPRNAIYPAFFYTLVSNYSHYAYNVGDYRQEWTSTDNDKSENCWLHHVFHKNDGYQVPLSLHPYRDWGSININTESHLSKQRLLTLFVHSYSKQEDNKTPFHVVNGKTAVALKLNDIGYSKLQTKTISQYFREHKNSILLADYTDILIYENDKTSLTIGAISALKKVYERYIHQTPEIHAFIDKLLEWDLIQDALPYNSDIKELLDVIEPTLGDTLNYDDAKRASSIIQLMRNYEKFNLCQLQRIALLEDVCELWRRGGFIVDGKRLMIDNPLDCIMKKYEDMSDKEKIVHYIIYKTISIFTTYPAYKKSTRQYEERTIFFEGESIFLTDLKRELSYAFDNPITMLEKDWESDSHVTQKLKQAYNYVYGSNPTKAIYTDKELYASYNGDSMLDLKRLSDKYKESLLHFENFPPPIFSWDICFRTEGGKEYVTLDSFSSGEKQKLNNIGAIIYHLLNINSVSQHHLKYHAVNIILEEIEIYFHPEWQREFVNYLLTTIRQFDLGLIDSINIILVTHSPYILSDIPKCNVLFLKDGRQIHDMQENTFGANIVSLLKNGFFLPSMPMGEFAYQKINSLFRILHSGDFDVTNIEKLKAEIMMVGEPVIRQQLQSLLNSYLKIGENPEMLNAILKIMRHKDDRPE